MRLLENTEGVLAVHEFHVWQVMHLTHVIIYELWFIDSSLIVQDNDQILQLGKRFHRHHWWISFGWQNDFLLQLTGDRIIASAHIRCLNLSEYMKIAENVKEFFHNEGIHSTTIQPEFVESEDPSAAGSIAMEVNSHCIFIELTEGLIFYLIPLWSSQDCAIGCPKDPGTQDQPSCQANKCCPPPSSKSTQNTPVTERRTNTEFGNGEVRTYRHVQKKSPVLISTSQA